MDKKELIRKAATSVIADEGFHNAKMQVIANKANIAIGTIYIYFKNKYEIIDYIFTVQYNKVMNFFEKLEEDNKSSLEKLKAYIRFQLGEMMKNPEVLKIHIQEGPLLQKLNNNIEQMNMKKMSRIAEIIKIGQKSGEIRDGNDDIIAYMIFQSIISYAYKLQSMENVSDHRVTQEGMVEAILQALKK